MNQPKDFDPSYKAKLVYDARKARQEALGIRLGSKWRRWKNRFLRSHPICNRCGMLAQEVHHKIPRAQAPELMYDASNCEALCHDCHIEHHRNDHKKS